MNASDYDKSIGMPDIEKGWAKFENDVINALSVQDKIPIPTEIKEE